MREDPALRASNTSWKKRLLDAIFYLRWLGVAATMVGAILFVFNPAGHGLTISFCGFVGYLLARAVGRPGQYFFLDEGGDDRSRAP